MKKEVDWIVRWIDGIGQERQTVYWDRNAALAEVKRLRGLGDRFAARIYKRVVEEFNP